MGSVGHGRWGLASQCDEQCMLRRVGCQHPVVAVAADALGRDQRGQPLDQFQGRVAQLGAPIGLGSGKAINDLAVRQLLEPLQRKGRARAIAQQPFQPGSEIGRAHV